MQRIDENTYIDDTLVTCAEYQLFIDEMREQGKFYQPDHWTSYQFAAGQAREPILGVRHSDAVAFCKWLTYQGDGNWVFRLPDKNEISPPKISKQLKKSIGYWVDNQDIHKQFEWIDYLRDDRHISYFLIEVMGQLEKKNRKNLSERPKVLQNLAPRLSVDFAIEHARGLDFIRFLDLEILYLHMLELVLPDAQKIVKKAKALQVNIKELSLYQRSIPRDPKFVKNIHIIKNSAIALALTLGRYTDIILVLDCYLDLFSLQERIAGRSPAFEGIRLVKERIK